jgi:hypothetical protein
MRTGSRSPARTRFPWELAPARGRVAHLELAPPVGNEHHLRPEQQREVVVDKAVPARGDGPQQEPGHQLHPSTGTGEEQHSKSLRQHHKAEPVTTVGGQCRSVCALMVQSTPRKSQSPTSLRSPLRKDAPVKPSRLENLKGLVAKQCRGRPALQTSWNNLPVARSVESMANSNMLPVVLGPNNTALHKHQQAVYFQQ